MFGPDFAREMERQVVCFLGCAAAFLVGFGVLLGGALAAFILYLRGG